MIGSRRLLLIGVIVGVVLLLGILATFLTKAKSAPEENACDTLLTYMIKGNYTDSYKLLSPAVATATSKDAWRTQVIGLTPSYYNGKLELVQTLPVAAQSDDSEGTVRTELQYTITTPATVNDASCYTVDDGGSVTVGGFASKVHEQ